MSILQIGFRISPARRRLLNIILFPVRLIITVLDFAFHKDNHLIVFGSNGGEHRSGSPKALFDYVQKKQRKFKGVYYAPFETTKNRYELVRYVIKFAPSFFRAKYLVSSHPPTDFLPFVWWSKRKVLINAWHGVPLKAMFFADKDTGLNDLRMVKSIAKNTNIFITASKLEAALISECFLINPKKVHYLGHPRNDVLLINRDKKAIMEIIAAVPAYEKVILYSPTYRRDGAATLFPFTDFDIAKLKAFLEEENIILLVRRHLIEKQPKDEVSCDRIIHFGFDVCSDINPVLPDIDLLITDYSSIYIDYLLLNRPCIFIPYDIKSYEERRGLLLDDYDFWTPGYKVQTFEEFVSAIKSCLFEDDIFAEEREQICRQFNFYQTDNSCDKILNILETWKNSKG
jgi:CDP-glycerol glycerophosphotransferase (TagB/SpsB family)